MVKKELTFVSSAPCGSFRVPAFAKIVLQNNGEEFEGHPMIRELDGMVIKVKYKESMDELKRYGFKEKKNA